MSTNDPTEQGLEIHPDAPEKDVDVFAHVLRELRKGCEQERPLSAVDFVHKARELFAANQPVSMDYLGTGLGLRFQDGMVLQFCQGAEMPGVGGVSGGLPISSPDGNTPGGKGRTMHTGDWNVTGGDQ